MAQETIAIDGSAGEGGGQVLRTSLALSLITQRPFRITAIRAKRKRPGLLRQHLTAVLAASEIGSAEVEGAELGSSVLEFRPGPVTPGHYRFAVGTAGSAALVFQTVFPPLLRAGGRSQLTLEGGTHNPLAPPWDFLARSFLPLVARLGPQVETRLERPGFYPAGGGRFTVEIEPAAELRPFELDERGEILSRRARALVANLPASIGERELAKLGELLDFAPETRRVEEIRGSAGPGNILLAELECEHLTAVFAGFGERGVRAETVALRCAEDVRQWLADGAPVDVHLADQLLIPFALVGSGAFTTARPSLHTRTNLTVIRRFLEVPIRIRELEPPCVRIEVG